MMSLSSFCLRALWAWPRGPFFCVQPFVYPYFHRAGNSFRFGFRHGAGKAVALPGRTEHTGHDKGAGSFGLCFLLVSLEDWLEGIVPLSGLLGVMSMAVMVQRRTPQLVGQDLSQKFSKLWMAAEPILFVLVGAAVDIPYAASAGIGVVAMIFLALVFRVLGVVFCMIGTALTKRNGCFV